MAALAVYTVPAHDTGTTVKPVDIAFITAALYATQLIGHQSLAVVKSCTTAVHNSVDLEGKDQLSL